MHARQPQCRGQSDPDLTVVDSLVVVPLAPPICRKTQGEWVSLLFVGCWQLLLGQMGQSNASLLGFVGSYGLVRTCFGVLL